MTDFDQENGPSISDLLHSRKIKLAVAVLALLVIGATVVLDILDFVGKWG